MAENIRGREDDMYLRVMVGLDTRELGEVELGPVDEERVTAQAIRMDTTSLDKGVELVDAGQLKGEDHETGDGK